MCLEARPAGQGSLVRKDNAISKIMSGQNLLTTYSNLLSEYSGCLIELSMYYVDKQGGPNDEVEEENKPNFEQCLEFAYVRKEQAKFWTYNKKTKKCTLRKSTGSDKKVSEDHVSGSSECGYIGRIDYENKGKYIPLFENKNWF